MLKFLLALLTAAVFWPAQALVLSPQMGLEQSASLSGHLTALRDPSGQLRIDEIVTPAKAAEFLALPGFLGAGYTADTYWLRFTLQRKVDAPEAWFVEVSPPYLNDVTLFVPDAAGRFQATRLGELFPFSARTIPHRSFIFPVRLQDDQPLTLYLRVKTSSTMMVRVKAWQYPGLLAEAQTDTSLYGIYFGILALGFVSNLLFWYWLRDRLYLSYCGYLAMLALVAMATGGFVSQWFFPDSPRIANRTLGVSLCLTFMLATHFFAGVLRLREHFPLTRHFINAMLIFCVLCALVSMSGHYGMVAPWLMLVGAIMSIYIALAGPWLLWRGHREYQFYILAFTVNFFAFPLTAAKLMGWMSLNMSTDYITVMGAIIHIVLLNFAVADRVRLSEKKMITAIQQTAELKAERDAAQQQRQFVSMVSHEFRTPLAVIDASAQSVQIACSQSTSGSYEFITPRQEKIRSAVRRLVSLLDNFLTNERLDFHKTSPQCTLVDLRDLASEAVHYWSHLVQDPAQLRLELGSVPLPVLAERSMMALALSNLIDNAFKYSPPGSPVTLRLGQTQGDGWIEVEDFGVGILASEIRLIFDKFYRSGRAQAVPGAGLGLFLVRTIARSQGGEIEVESTPGQGSLFRLRMALVK